MDNTYFERLHRDESRRAEWRMLDEALVTRTERAPHNRRGLRVALGHMMIRAGARLAGERPLIQLDASSDRHSLN